jgi:hypothetical protein
VIFQRRETSVEECAWMHSQTWIWMCQVLSLGISMRLNPSYRRFPWEVAARPSQYRNCPPISAPIGLRSTKVQGWRRSRERSEHVDNQTGQLPSFYDQIASPFRPSSLVIECIDWLYTIAWVLFSEFLGSRNSIRSTTSRASWNACPCNLFHAQTLAI